MKKYIVLLRGVNVGGRNLLPMKILKSCLENSGFEEVSTYIQSGNIVLKASKKPELELKELIQSEFGFTPEVLALSEKEFNSAVANNPYPNHEGKTVHFYFCKKTPKIDSARLKKLSADSESSQCVAKVFYIHAPDGIGRSKLVASIESVLGVSATGRNLNTVNKLMIMVNGD